MFTCTFPEETSVFIEQTFINKDSFVIKYTNLINNKISDILELTSLMTEYEKDDYYMVVNLFDFISSDSSSFIFDTDREIVHLWEHTFDILEDLQERMLERLDSIVLLCKTGK